jgi:hypothetical protein
MLDVAALVAQDTAPTPSDALGKIRDAARRLRDLEAEIVDLTERTTEKKAEVSQLKQKELVDLMNEAGVDNIGLPAEGNMPAYDAKAGAYYHANIGADWPPEKRDAAFAWLEEHGHGDLLKAVVTVAFGRRELEQARTLENTLRDMGLSPNLSMSVPWATLTAWLKEQVERRHAQPPLELLGATVGQIVKLTPRKD